MGAMDIYSFYAANLGSVGAEGLGKISGDALSFP